MTTPRLCVHVCVRVCVHVFVCFLLLCQTFHLSCLSDSVDRTGCFLTVCVYLCLCRLVCVCLCVCVRVEKLLQMRNRLQGITATAPQLFLKSAHTNTLLCCLVSVCCNFTRLVLECEEYFKTLLFSADDRRCMTQCINTSIFSLSPAHTHTHSHRYSCELLLH